MTQTEFDAELALGKRSWQGSHVEGDLDVSEREIHGDVCFSGMTVSGDLDLSGTVIHGSLELVDARVSGNLNLDGLRVMGRFNTNQWSLANIDGEVIANDLVVRGRLRTITSHRAQTQEP